MSQSPATPAGKQDMHIESKAAMASIDKASAASKVKQVSLYEPSPASTYGDTVGSSAPATPQDVASHDPIAGLMQSLRAAQIDPAIQTISGSPMSGRQAKKPEELLRLQSQASLSPVKQGKLADVFGNLSASSSSSSTKQKMIRESPTWRHSAQQSDNVFDSNSKLQYSPRQGDNFSSPRNGRAGRQGLNSPDGPANVMVSRDTSQRFLLPEGCVFVANLVSTMAEDQLEHHVQTAFMQFGDCFTKVKRDGKNMPFAFVQYHTADDAKKAITEGRGIPIAGRPCRAEAAKVHRSVYLSRVTGGPISEAEARQIMGTYGVLEQVWYCTPTEQEWYGLPKGVWVKYKYFDECRDAQAGLRDNAHFRLEQPPTPENGRFRGAAHTYQAGSPMQRSSPSQTKFSPSRRDQCSIFVGGLPTTSTDDGLGQLFMHYGYIMNVETIRKGSVYGVDIFAFVEFAEPYMAVHAVQGAQGVIYDGNLLRVEFKKSLDPAYRRNGSPRSNIMGGSPMGMSAYQQGVLAGRAQAGTQAMPPPPVYPNYYYSAGPTFGQYPVNNTMAVNQSQGNSFMTQPMGQYPQTYIPSQYLHAQIQAPVQPQVPAQAPVQQQSLYQSTYEWPLPNADSDNTGMGQ